LHMAAEISRASCDQRKPINALSGPTSAVALKRKPQPVEADCGCARGRRTADCSGNSSRTANEQHLLLNQTSRRDFVQRINACTQVLDARTSAKSAYSRCDPRYRAYCQPRADRRGSTRLCTGIEAGKRPLRAT
jgi:hypothetical protein